MEVQPDAYVWMQVVEEIRSRIAAAQYRRRQPIPAERRLAEELGVAVGTVRKAVAHLRDAGELYTLPQKGTFVSPPEGE
ncbi:winged helix-turn-helix transcriptional regulator [Nonomuraea sp. K274]|uniref:Winged helix-turn-helix transcriptional regulator n=1 Tax=Nonomuraea cypriaca TaxID=1187855 RepID=A0A931AI96_9ACTN|nr:winged helix-turn-helix domain-containing protein [Nonomuraea cypriaca]MBF8192448.1 winged helix-turn-helix transcriptional regulator [Nonomuraea cypriaca]